MSAAPAALNFVSLLQLCVMPDVAKDCSDLVCFHSLPISAFRAHPVAVLVAAVRYASIFADTDSRFRKADEAK